MAVSLMEDRQLFFSSAPNKPDAHSKSLAFLSVNHDKIEKERAALKIALDALKIDTASAIKGNEKREQYRLWYLYCCELLKTYHEQRNEPENPPKDWINYVHDNIGYVHGFRILLAFSRITDELLIRMMNDTKWFDKLNRSIAPIFDFDQSITLLNLPVQTFYLLSFSLLGLRFLIEVARILKHTFKPTEQELKALSSWDRFRHEAKKYHFNIANDIVWGILNAINNSPLMLVCVLFDLSVILYRQRETQHAYKEKKAEYELLLPLNKQDEVIQQQLKVLKLNHTETTATLRLMLIATSEILIGLSLLITAPLPILAPIGSFLCVIGFAVCLSADLYGDYEKKTEKLKQLKADEESSTEIKKAEQAQLDAWNKGWSSFTKNAIIPTLFMGALAICWPATVLFVAGYAACEMSQPKEEKTPLFAPA